MKSLFDKELDSLFLDKGEVLAAYHDIYIVDKPVDPHKAFSERLQRPRQDVKKLAYILIYEFKNQVDTLYKDQKDRLKNDCRSISN